MTHPAATRARALALVGELGSAAAAAREVGVPVPTVNRWCREAGLTLFRGGAAGRRVQAVRQEVLALLEADELSGGAIARHCGISESAVAVIARDAGIRLHHRPRPVVVRDLGELDRRIDEISEVAERTAETTASYRRMAAAFVAWCSAAGRQPHLAESVAAYLCHQAAHGTSGRPGTRGQPVGWTLSTLHSARDAIMAWLEAEGFSACRSWRQVASAMECLSRSAHPGTSGSRRLTEEELGALASVPPPEPTAAVLRVRLSLLAHAEAPDLTPLALTRALASVTTGAVTLDATTAAIRLRWQRGYQPRVVAFTHNAGGLITCGHCIVSALLDGTAPGERLAGTRSAEVAAKTTGIALRRARVRAGTSGTPSGSELLRLLVWADPAWAAWCRTQAYTALARTTGYRNDELRLLDLGDITIDDGRYWTFLIRRRKNDQRGQGMTVGVDALYCPETIGRLVTWLWLRGNGEGPLFPSPRGGCLSKGGSSRAVVALAVQAGLEREKFGVHSFRRTAISDLLDRGVFLSVIAGRLGITDQVVFDYFEARTTADTPTLLGLSA